VREVALFAVLCGFGVVSGFNDGGNLIASFTSGRVISPHAAAWLLLLVPLGPLVAGTRVAQTIGTNVIDLGAQGATGFALIALVSMTVALASWRWRIPISMTIALIGAMLGWVLAVPGASGIRWQGVAKSLVGTPLSVIAGLGCAFLLHRAARRALGRLPFARALRIARMQYFTSALQAVAYGSNDMEKTIGLVAAAEIVLHRSSSSGIGRHAPLLLASGSFLGGAFVGGWRVARRVSSGIFRVRPVEALTEQLSAGLVVVAFAAAGAPVSSTQATGGSLVGVGISVGASGVRWSAVRQLCASWLVTFPLAFGLALVLHLVLRVSLGIR
jgi:PiT family inorganic phosphate transporter